MQYFDMTTKSRACSSASCLLMCKIGSLKTGPWENSSTLHNVRGELFQLQSMHRQLDTNNTLIGTFSKNILKYPKFTYLLVDDIGLGSPSYSWQWYLLTTDNSHEISALNIALHTSPVRILFGRVFHELFAVVVFHVRCAMWTNFLRGEFT